MEPTPEKPPAYAWYALVVLMIVYILNFLDRTIIYILFPLIKKEMDFSDTQLALLGTTSFVIFYTVLGNSIWPTGRSGLAHQDHRDRCDRLEFVFRIDCFRDGILDSVLLSGDGRCRRGHTRSGGDLASL